MIVGASGAAPATQSYNLKKKQCFGCKFGEVPLFGNVRGDTEPPLGNATSPILLMQGNDIWRGHRGRFQAAAEPGLISEG